MRYLIPLVPPCSELRRGECRDGRAAPSPRPRSGTAKSLECSKTRTRRTCTAAGARYSCGKCKKGGELSRFYGRLPQGNRSSSRSLRALAPRFRHQAAGVRLVYFSATKRGSR